MVYDSNIHVKIKNREGEKGTKKRIKGPDWLESPTYDQRVTSGWIKIDKPKVAL